MKGARQSSTAAKSVKRSIGRGIKKHVQNALRNDEGFLLNVKIAHIAAFSSML